MIVRAWPDHPTDPAAPHVIDGWPRVQVDDYDYRGLAELGDDVVSMDWDTACSLEDLQAFAARAEQEPGRVLVAPMRMYRTGPDAVPGVWNLCRVDDAGTEHRVGREGPVHHFGFGMIYLPRALILGYMEHYTDARLIDAWFGYWHHRHVAPEPRVDWTVSPVHLHYPQAQAGRL